MLGRPSDRVSRRAFLRAGAAATAAAGATAAGLGALPEAALADDGGFHDPGPSDLLEVTIAELQARLEACKLSSPSAS
jgi:hypothetical protein